MLQPKRDICIPFKVTQVEHDKIQVLMGKLDRDGSSVVRLAIKMLYNEIVGK